MIAWIAVIAAAVFFAFWGIACAVASSWKEKAVKAELRERDCKRHLLAVQPSLNDHRRAVKLLTDFETAVCKQYSQSVRFGDAQGSNLRGAVNDARQAILDRMRPMELEEDDGDHDDGD